MKKFKIVLSVLLAICSLAFADEHTLKNVPKGFTGTYYPVALEMMLGDSMEYEKSLNTIAPTNYEFFMLRDDICYTTLYFADGYAVKAKDIEKWSFVDNKNGKFILDENGCSYRKISDDSSYEGYKIFCNYTLSILFRDAIKNKNISIKDDTVTINGKTYTMNPARTYSSKSFIVSFNNGAYFLIKDGLGAKITTGISSGHWMSDPSDKVVDEIPLFFWHDSEYPKIDIETYNMSKKDLRLLRNIFYAKHGYIFKSEDLKNIFESFEWYKPNTKFTEDEFLDYEKIVIEKILKEEKK